MMVMNFSFNILSLSDKESNVAYAAHVGGALGGVIYYLFGQRPQFKKKSDPGKSLTQG
ncbi:MAG: hypothetical protein KA715_11460 [Xanthomonadaceae bacterium]|nr:hypothetical protein [Xanthomonadaceae bacterium]